MIKNEALEYSPVVLTNHKGEYMKKFLFYSFLILGYYSANANESSIVCKSYCEANFERTVPSPFNAYSANKIYSIKLSELNIEIESVSANDRQAAFAAAQEACKQVIENDVAGYNKRILSLMLFTDSTKSVRLNLSNLNCISAQVLP